MPISMSTTKQSIVDILETRAFAELSHEVSSIVRRFTLIVASDNNDRLFRGNLVKC